MVPPCQNVSPERLTKQKLKKANRVSDITEYSLCFCHLGYIASTGLKEDTMGGGPFMLSDKRE